MNAYNSSTISDTDVAIIGMAGRFPGADKIDQFWSNISRGVESVSFFSDSALLKLGVDATLLRRPRYVKAGAVLKNAEWFDAAFFGFKPAEALIIDPQHRVFLECAWEAMENAGYPPDRCEYSVGVYAGSNFSSYLSKLRANRKAFSDFGEFLALISNDKDYLTSRVSYKLNLKGPSLAIQTACSTSLVAIHVACQSVISGECDMALAGGVGISALRPAGYLYEEGGIHSPDGHCRPFDVKSAGTVSGSGVGIVALKRLPAALADRDVIHAVIKGSSVNNDGADKVSFTAPAVEGQARAITEALAVAAVHPDTIGYVEAHGTGTPLGDPIEIAALAQAFRTKTARKQFCAIGSVKSNIGHLTAAAGVAGLIKAVSAVKEGVIPPSPYFEAPNPKLDLPNSPFFVNKELMPWPEQNHPRRALVSSLGIGGTNAHVVIEQAPECASSEPSRPFQLLPLSAKTSQALDTITADLHGYFEQNPAINIADVAYTLQVGRSQFRHRRAVLCKDHAEAVRLTADLSGDRVLAGVSSDHKPSVAFLFPGGGAQFAGMGADLYQTEPLFRQNVDRCCDFLQTEFGFDLRGVLFPPPERVRDAEEAITSALMAHPALFVIEYSLAAFWMELGIVPDVLIGHSMGEYAAAAIAGVFSLEDALRVVVLRGKMIEQTPRGAMLAVPVSERSVSPLLTSSVSLAAVNAPTSCIISGVFSEIEAIEAHLREQSIDCRRLRFSHASHSPMMDAILGDFATALRLRHLNAPSIPLMSNLTGAWMTPADAQDPNYWAKHLRQIVRFSDGLREILNDDSRILIETGPGQTIGKLVRRQSPKYVSRTVHTSLASANDEISDSEHASRTVAGCWITGLPINWSAYSRFEERRRVSLPTYPFERRRFWIEDESGNGEADERLQGTPHTLVIPPTPSAAQPSPAGNRGSRLRSLEASITQIFARLFGFPAEDISTAATLLELGADSLLLMRASRSIEDEFGVVIPFRSFMSEVSSISAIASHLDKALHPESNAEVLLQESKQAVAAEAPRPEQSQTAPAGSAASSLEQIVLEQLRIMSEQVKLLSGSSRVPSASGTTRPGESSEANAPQPSNVQAIRHATAELASTGQTASFGPFHPVQPSLVSSMTSEQASHVLELVACYNNRTSTSKAYADTYRRSLADPRAAAGFQAAWKEMIYPIVGQRSLGSKLWDVDGNEYVDYTMGFGVHLFGHSPIFVIDAIQKQLACGIQLGPQSERAGRVAQLICDATSMERVAFCNSGSEAMMGAIRMARAVTGRSKIVMFTGSYHGSFDGVLARARLAQGVRETVPVAAGTAASMVSDVIVLEYGDSASLGVIEKRASEIAAVLVEPVQSRNLDLQPSAFLKELRDITSRRDVALIFDEIITGFRIHPAGAQGWFGVKADLAAYGKVIGGGLPIGVVAGSARYLDPVDGGDWRYGDDSFPMVTPIIFAGTFSKNPLAMAAAEAVLEELKRRAPTLHDELNAATTALVSELTDVFQEEHVPIRVSHFGSMFRFTREPSARWLDLLFFHVLNRGIYIWEGRGCFLSAAHTQEDNHRFIAAVRAAAAELQRGGFVPKHRTMAAGVGNVPDIAPQAHLSETEQVELIPLTAPMRQVWVHSHLNPDAARTYNEVLALRFRGNLDVGALRGALARIAGRHQALRAAFDSSGEFLCVASTSQPELQVSDKTAAYPEQREGLVESLLESAADEHLDFSRGPLFRAWLHRLEEAHHLFVFVFYHGIMDGFAVNVFTSELAGFYSDLTGAGSYKPPRTCTLREYVDNKLAQESEAALQQGRKYWTELLAGASALDLGGHAKPLRPEQGKGGRERLLVDSDRYTALCKLAAVNHCTLFTVLLSAFCALLHRWSGQDDFVLGIPILGREFRGDENMLGHCVDIQPVRSRRAASTSFREFLRLTAQQLSNSAQHGAVVYSHLCQWEKKEGEGRLVPVINATFNLDPKPVSGANDPWRSSNLEVTQAPASVRYVKFTIHWNIAESTDGLHLSCDFNNNHFGASIIRRMLEVYVDILDRIAENPDLAIAALPISSGGSRQLMQASVPEPAPKVCVHSLVEYWAAQIPDRVAVFSSEGTLSYQDLNSRANQLAHLLRKFGTGPEKRIAVCLPRGEDMVVSILGILKAGGAYVPLDPGAPLRRLRLTVKDADVAAVITNGQLRSQLAPEAQTFCIDEQRREIGAQNCENPAVVVDPDNAAYVIYTSGSTGTPKGVCVSHASLANFVGWHRSEYQVTESDMVTQVANPSFDACGWEIWGALTSGAGVCIAEALSSERAMIDWMTRAGATVSFIPTPLAEELLVEEWPPQSPLRVLLTGGDFLRRVPNGRFPFAIVNAYGPTEATIVSTCEVVQPGEVSPPIGRPIRNYKAYVVNKDGELAPPGVVGELYLGGVGLARGYLSRPAHTADRFVPDTFGNEPGGRLYKTGDLVRRRDSGVLDFVGRTDHQVKIHGFRIEPGEIESLLMKQTGVRQAAVIVRDNQLGEKRLVAFLESQSGFELSIPAIRQNLQVNLPEYMIPSSFVQLESLPLTPNGKIDRKGLLSVPIDENPVAAYVAPRTETETAVTAIWESVFRPRQVGVHDNFFDLGGDSLVAMRVVSRLRNTTNAYLDIATVFQHPSPAELAAYLDTQPAQFRVAQQMAVSVDHENS